MKKLTTKLISFILMIAMVFTTTIPAFASTNTHNTVEESSGMYTLVSTEETEYGTVYYITDSDGVQTRSLWDLVDVLMAGASWAKLFSQPSWGNFGWAVLDTAALLPLLPSSAYFREGGKVFLKVDEVAEFAKTSDGSKAISSAMKTFQYSEGIADKAVKEINKKFKGTEGKKVLQLFEDAADKGMVGSTGQSGIKKINPSSVIGKEYTHEIKIKSSQYGDYRIYGFQEDSGEWVFDLFRRGLGH